jgi:hypothetical protein
MNKLIISMAVILCFTGLLAAAEYPVEQNPPVVKMAYPPVEDKIENQQTQPPQPVWTALENMNADQRANSNIVIELGMNASDQARQLAGRISALWNAGDYTKALQLFPELGAMTDEIAIGNCWRTPLTNGEVLWGTDVQIGRHVDIYENEFDKDWETGNLFVVLLYESGGTWYWSMNFSSNNGDTWSETYEWWASYELNTIGATVLTEYCYVGYSGGSAQTEARLRRFNVADGSTAPFPDGSSFVTAFTMGAAINEIVLTSNADFYDNRIYYYVLCADGVVTYYWDDPDCLSFDEIAPGITNAREGLDATCNEGYDTYFTMLSYLNTDDQVSIWLKGTTWDNAYNYNVNHTSTDYTAIGAYHDTITCAFDYYNGSNLQCRYLVNYTGGTGTWYYGEVGDDPNTTAESPDIACRRDGGTGIVWRFYTSPREERFVWRHYGGTWDPPETFSDHEPYYNKPNIEYLGDGCYGVVYLRWSDYSAWFDKCVEQPCLDIWMVNHGPDPVPAGGRFRVQGFIENTCNAAERTDIWYGVLYNNVFYEQGTFLNLNVPANTTLSGMFWQRVPRYAPAGIYEYVSYFGDYATGAVEGSFRFRFSIVRPIGSGGATEWSTIGGMFDDYTVSPDIPGDLALHGNFPNPFNAETNISFDIPVDTYVSLEVYNLLGQKVATLVDGNMSAGNHSVSWDASTASSGVYFYKLTAGDQVFTERMTLLK